MEHCYLYRFQTYWNLYFSLLSRLKLNEFDLDLAFDLHCFSNMKGRGLKDLTKPMSRQLRVVNAFWHY